MVKLYTSLFLLIFNCLVSQRSCATEIAFLKIDNVVIDEVKILSDSLVQNQYFSFEEVKTLPQFSHLKHYDEAVLRHLVNILNPIFLNEIDSLSVQYKICGYLIEKYFADPQKKMGLNKILNESYNGIDATLAKEKLVKYHQNLLFGILLQSGEWNIKSLTSKEVCSSLSTKTIENLIDKYTDDNEYGQEVGFVILNHSTNLYKNNF